MIPRFAPHSSPLLGKNITVEVFLLAACFTAYILLLFDHNLVVVCTNHLCQFKRRSENIRFRVACLTVYFYSHLSR